jgi:plasmid stabilization system protein ParE
MKYRISRLADRDIECIWRYIARDSVTAADRVEEEIHQDIKKLAEFPGMGHARADISDPRYRFWSIYSYIIAYRMEREELLVVRIIHGAREIRKVLGRQVRG